MASVIAFGEVFVDADFTDYGKPFLHLGGACANMISNISLLGGKTGIIVKLKDDIIGNYIIQQLEMYGVETGAIIHCSDENLVNVLNVVDRSNMSSRFITYSANCANDTLHIDEINFSLLSQFDVFHFGSHSLTLRSVDTLNSCLSYAKRHRIMISYDVNYRDGLWRSRDIAVSTIRKYVDMADIIHMNKKEALIYSDTENFDYAIRYIEETCINKTVLITDSHNGVIALSNIGVKHLKCPAVNSLDTTGAGDAFCAYFLDRFDSRNCENGSIFRICESATIIASLSTKYIGTVEAFKSALRDYKREYTP